MTSVCQGVSSVERRRESLRIVGGPCVFPLNEVRKFQFEVIGDIPEEIE